MAAGICAAPANASCGWRRNADHCGSCACTKLPCRLCFTTRSYSGCHVSHSPARTSVCNAGRKLEKALFGTKLKKLHPVLASGCVISKANWLPICWATSSKPGNKPRTHAHFSNKILLEAKIIGMVLSFTYFSTKNVSGVMRLLSALHDFGNKFPRGFLQELSAGVASDIRLAAMRSDLPIHANFAKVDWSTSRISYMIDVMLERHPMSYMLLLILACMTLTLVGGLIIYRFRTFNQRLEDSFWDAWACVCASSMHLKETTRTERAIGLMLAMCGLLFYSLLMSTVNTQFKNHMDRLREGAHSQVYENGHIVVCGANNHIATVLKQINKRQELSWRAGSARSRKQTVLLLSERTRASIDKLIMNVKDQPHLTVLTRSGSLSSTMSFLRVAAEKARTVIFLSNKDDTYEADADVVLSVLALRPLLEGFLGNVIAEVSKASTADLVKSLAGTIRVNPVQNLSAKLFVQCSRQPGLRDVYRQVLSYKRHVINLYKFPGLSGLHYQQVRRGFPEAIICGIMREGKLDFHPNDDLVVRSNDKFLVVAPKGTQREAPKSLLSVAERYRKTFSAMEKMLCDCRAGQKPITEQQAKPVPKLEKVLARKERIVILGWRSDVCDMVLEYDEYVGAGSEVVVLAEASLDERQVVMDRRFSKPLRNIHFTHKVGNPMSRTDLKHAITNIAPEFGSEDAPPLSIVVIADKKWHVGDTSKADKQSAFALLLAQALCKELKIKVTSLVAEFIDKKLGKQVVRSHPSLNYICTHELTGLVTAQVSEDSDLNAVWTELLNSWGNEIYVQDIGLYASAGEAPSFNELSERAVLREEVAIGYKRGNKVIINPTSKEIPLRFKPGDALVVIAEAQYGQ